MLAYRYHPGEKKLFRDEIDRPSAGPGEVVLRIRAAGVCHSDLHILDGDVPFLQNMFTMGHEACGEIFEIGTGIPGPLRRDRLYVVHGPNPCGGCEYCRTGKDNLCNSPTRAGIGIGADGAYAEFLKVPARNIVEVPEGISPEIAAVATDAVLTPYHALKTLAGVHHGTSVLILGLGGLGLNGVQVARALGAEVFAADIRESTLYLARGLGAKEACHVSDLETRMEGAKVDVIADCVGRESTFALAQKLVKPGGTVLVIGLASSQVPLAPMVAAVNEIRVQGSFWGTNLELREVLRLIAEGRIRPQVEQGRLEDVEHWIDGLRDGRVRSRIALAPRALEALRPKAA